MLGFVASVVLEMRRATTVQVGMRISRQIAGFRFHLHVMGSSQCSAGARRLQIRVCEECGMCTHFEEFLTPSRNPGKLVRAIRCAMAGSMSARGSYIELWTKPSFGHSDESSSVHFDSTCPSHSFELKAPCQSLASASLSVHSFATLPTLFHSTSNSRSILN